MSRKRREQEKSFPATPGKRLTTAEEHKQFIADNWDHLAGMAWRGYQEYGRGFIDIIVDKVQGEPNGKLETFCAFASERLLAKDNLSIPEPELKRLVQQYDPEAFVVLLFHWMEDSSRERRRIYRVASDPSPCDTVWLGNVGRLKVRA